MFQRKVRSPTILRKRVSRVTLPQMFQHLLYTAKGEERKKIPPYYLSRPFTVRGGKHSHKCVEFAKGMTEE